MPAFFFLLPLAVLTGAGGPPPPNALAQTLAAGQVWSVEARTAEGKAESWRLRLTSLLENGPERVTWSAALEGALHPNVSQVRLGLERPAAGRTLLTALVQTFDGRSQPDLQICLVVDPLKVPISGFWSGVYGLGLSGSRALNAYLVGRPAQNLGTCTLKKRS